MTELFIQLLGTCVVYWCTFGVNWHDPDEPTLLVRAWDKNADTIEIYEFPINQLLDHKIILAVE